MKSQSRFGSALTIILALSLVILSGCGTTSQGINSPQAKAAINAARSAGRVVIEIELQQRAHIPVATTAAALAILDASVLDPAINGGTFELVLDQALWVSARAKLIADASKAIASYKVQGVQMFDQPTSDLLAAAAVDAIAEGAKVWLSNRSAPKVTP